MTTYTFTDHDPEVEAAFVVPLDLVTFDPLQSTYSPEEDIFAVYQIDPLYRSSKRDWLGIYKAGWIDPHNYVTYQWAPKACPDTSSPRLRCVIFPANSLGVISDNQELYQVLYITKFNQVFGRSNTFRIQNNPAMSHLMCVERPLSGVDSLTFVESNPTEQTGSLEDFEIVKDHSSGSESSLIAEWLQSFDQLIAESSQSTEDMENVCDQLTLASGLVQSDGSILEITDALAETEPTNAAEDSVADAYHSNPERALVPFRGDVLPYTSPGEMVPYMPLSQLIYDVAKACKTKKSDEVMTPISTIYFGPRHNSTISPLSTLESVVSGPSLAQHLTLIAHHTCCIPSPSPSPLTILLPLPGDAKLTLPLVTPQLATSSQQAPVLPRSAASSGDQVPTTATSVTCREKVTRSKPAVRRCCRECKKKRKRSRALRRQLRTTTRNADKLQKELQFTEEMLALKTQLVDEFAAQVKSLIHENGQLCIITDRLHNEKAALTTMAIENENLKNGATFLTFFIEKLQSDITKLKDEKQQLEEQVEKLQSQGTQLQTQKGEAESALNELQKNHSELQSQLDDLMFSLALPCATKVHDSNGHDVVVSQPGHGRPLELGGWTLATNKRTDRFLATIASQESTISGVQLRCEHLQQQLKDAEQSNTQLHKQLAAEQQSNKMLSEHIMELEVQLTELTDKEQEAASLLQSERRCIAGLHQQLDAQAQSMQTRITSLQNALEAAQIIKSQALQSKQAVDQHSRCSQTACVQHTPQCSQTQDTHHTDDLPLAVPKTKKASTIRQYAPPIAVLSPLSPGPDTTEWESDTTETTVTSTTTEYAAAADSGENTTQDTASSNTLPDLWSDLNWADIFDLENPELQDPAIMHMSSTYSKHGNRVSHHGAITKPRRPRKFHFQVRSPRRVPRTSLQYTPRMFAPRPASTRNYDRHN